MSRLASPALGLVKRARAAFREHSLYALFSEQRENGDYEEVAEIKVDKGKLVNL
jgi:hypothetical protein